jgi:hypothetical protein
VKPTPRLITLAGLAAMLQACASIPLEGNERVVCYHPKAMGVPAPYGPYSLVAIGPEQASQLAAPQPDPRRRVQAQPVMIRGQERVLDRSEPDARSGSLCFTLPAYEQQAASDRGACLGVRGPRGLLPVREGASRFGITWAQAGFRNPLWEGSLASNKAEAARLLQHAEAMATRDEARTSIETRRTGLAQQGLARREDCSTDAKAPTLPPRPANAIDEATRSQATRTLCAESWRTLLGADSQRLFTLAGKSSEWVAADFPGSAGLPRALIALLPANRVSKGERSLLKSAINDNEADGDILELFRNHQAQCISRVGEAFKLGLQQWQEHQRMAQAAPAERRAACNALFDGIEREQQRLDEASRLIERLDTERSAGERTARNAGSKPIDLRNLACSY